jgi:transposase InsO family protein
MKQLHPNHSIQMLCELFGKSRQAWYKSEKTATRHQELNSKLLDFVKNVRKDQPKIGTDKLQYMINAAFALEGTWIGRDALYNLLRANGMLIRIRKKYRPPSTNGNGESIYPDLRKGLVVNEINQLWSCDITYIALNDGNRHCYATFVIDEKSHLIVGYHVSLEMTAKETLIALRKAVENQAPVTGKFNFELIFHTDRGSQFKSILFRNFLEQHEIKISMTEYGKSSENPVSERLNGILKNELMFDDSFDEFYQASSAIDKAVHIYTDKRPHLSCEMLTPREAHQPGLGVLTKLWKQRKKKDYGDNHS